MYVLLFFILLFILGLLSFYASHKAKKYSDKEEVLNGFGTGLTFLGLLGIIILMIGLIGNQVTYERDLVYYNSLKTQLADIRADKTRDIERVAISKEIIDYNLKLANEKYDNENQWDWWTPDTLANLKPIK